MFALITKQGDTHIFMGPNSYLLLRNFKMVQLQKNRHGMYFITSNKELHHIDKQNQIKKINLPSPVSEIAAGYGFLLIVLET
jgi:hypothetical protein